MSLFTYLPSPLGDLLLTSDGRALTGLYFAEGGTDRGRGRARLHGERDDAWFAPIRSRLDAYFEGEPLRVDVPLAPAGTPFQLAVWEALRSVEHGTTTSYGRLAAAVGRPTAVRAVAQAVGRNPISIVVPCHRVIGADGTLTGYGGGLDRKAWLLDLERQAAGCLV